MKKWITIDVLIIGFLATVAGSFGYSIPSALNLPGWLCLVICLAAAIIFEEIGDRIIFSKFTQSKASRKYLMFAIFILLFFIGNWFYKRLYGETLYNDLSDQFVQVFIFALIGFTISIVKHYIKRKRIKDKYNDAEEGFKFNAEEKEIIEDLNQINKEITGEYDTSLAVRTRTGVFVGEKDEDVISFNGIPYAKPPVGGLRWKAPKKLENCDKVFEAKHFGPSSIQVSYKGNVLSSHQQSEDCLYLNVYTTDIASDELKPVVVYFHGGDFSYGGSADPLWDLRNFTKTSNTVTVSFNYRLGFLGFADFLEIPGGEDYKDTSNLGLLDQIAVLEWVKENIHNFGGNPEQITAIGDGSGGISISLLAVCERARGLFNKAIILSGNPLSSLTESANDAKQKQNLIEATSASNMDKLLALSKNEIVALTQKLKGDFFIPKRDDKLIPEDVYEAYRQGKAKDIEFIICASKDISNVYSSSIGRGFGEEVIGSIIEYNISKQNPDTAKRIRTYLYDETMRIGKEKAKAKIANTWIDQAGLITLSEAIQQGGGSVKAMYWNVNAFIKELGSGDVDIINTLLGNDETSVAYGSATGESIREILQSLFIKYIFGDKTELFNGELEGINAIKWGQFPSVLTVNNKEVKPQPVCDAMVEAENFLKLIKE